MTKKKKFTDTAVFTAPAALDDFKSFLERNHRKHFKKSFCAVFHDLCRMAEKRLGKTPESVKSVLDTEFNLTKSVKDAVTERLMTCYAADALTPPPSAAWRNKQTDADWRNRAVPVYCLFRDRKEPAVKNLLISLVTLLQSMGDAAPDEKIVLDRADWYINGIVPRHSLADEMNDDWTDSLTPEEMKVLQEELGHLLGDDWNPIPRFCREFTAGMTASQQAYIVVLVSIGLGLFHEVSRDKKLVRRLQQVGHFKAADFAEIKGCTEVLDDVVEEINAGLPQDQSAIELPTPELGGKKTEARAKIWSQLIKNALDHVRGEAKEAVEFGFYALGSFLLLLQQIPLETVAPCFKGIKVHLRPHILVAMGTLFMLAEGINEKMAQI